MNKINVGTLCSGYDSQCMALDELRKMHQDFDYELVFWSEIDKYAIKTHNALYPQWRGRNVGDMTKVDWTRFKGIDIDLLTYSTPCTDISNAGRQKGLAEGSGTRSSILWHTRKCIEVLRPKWLMLENVKALVSHKFLPDLRRWLGILDELGYVSTYRVCKATEVNVPQNRERLFVVSMRVDREGEMAFRFPQPLPLTRRLFDVKEDEDVVGERYYLRDKVVNSFIDRVNNADKEQECTQDDCGWLDTMCW